jgi:hypothetical protein
MADSLKLTRLSGFERGKSATYPQSKITLGTDASCDLRFDPTWDRTVSARHAELVWEGQAWWVVDHSRDGTLIDGQKVPRRKLGAEATLELGKGGPKVRVEVLAAASSSIGAVPAPAAVAPPSPAPVASPPAAAAPPPLPASSGGAAPRAKSPGWLPWGGALVLLALLGGVVWWLSGRGNSEAGLAKVAREQAGAVALVTVVPPGGQPIGMATAWAAAPRVYVTNAHVVSGVDMVLKDGGSAFLVVNRDGQRRLRIVGTRLHPRYTREGINFEGRESAVPGYDVGMLLTEADAPATLRIAGARELARVDSGYRIAYLGFPMEGMAGGGVDVRNPVATMQSGIVTAATDFWLGKAEFEQRLLIQHNLGATGGASGSPMFNASGEVVAILSAGNISGVLRTSSGDIARVPSGVLVNFAQRVDILKDIWPEYPR